MAVNTMPVAAGRAFEVLQAGFRAQAAGAMTASWMLHGRPGIGKTEIVQRLARETGARLIDLRLTTIEPQDLRGLPYYDHATRRTVWYRPEDLPEDAGPAILFLDELTAAAPMLQPAVYGLLQERRVGRHVLPDATFVVAAGNGVEDGAIAHEMGTALSDRLIHLNLRAEAGDWIENFALPAGVHPAVTAFIRIRPDMLETTEEALRRGLTIACTPRSWARVSAILQAVGDRRLREVMIAGTVGEGPAAEFALIAGEIAATVAVEEIVAAEPRARTELFPASLHGLTALVYGLVAVAQARNLPAVIEVMAGVGGLAAARPGEGFDAMPLAELCGHGFELLIGKALKAGWQEAFLSSRAYAEYAAARRAAGLE